VIHIFKLEIILIELFHDPLDRGFFKSNGETGKKAM
jgi:hypothetical protein